ncbi:hypothetical protein JZ751_023084 [Albula glossodonta]|uniref:Ig-like domain-containing protein n=1 Tax=Albula glossodonta TaxID=121402 RepID=A0A8T2PEQ6_9TELE|nr:hypothetical protein JZ751_023084 [Albula glossodonta]
MLKTENSTSSSRNFGIKLVHMDMISAAVGQQVNLSCMMNSEDQNLNIEQIEWRKVEPQEHKIAIYSPSYGPYTHWGNVSLYTDDFRGKLRGSILQLPAVDVWDSGRYVCELTTYPHGTVKAETNLTVTDVHLSARVMRPNRTVIEGDDVTILCTSTPPADTYSLWPSKFLMFNSSRQSSDMAAEGRVMAATLLLFITFTQGNFGIKLVRMDMISTAVGQQVNLSCMMNSEDQNLNIAQIEWRKVEPQEHKIAIYNPSYGPYIHWKNISLYIDDFRGKLRGSILQLPAVDVWDSGRYVCELTTYPHGTVKEEKILTVTNIHLSARVMRPNRTVIEGDDVTILCTSTPPADTYSLWPSKGNVTTSNNSSLHLHSVSSKDTGVYTLTAAIENTGLQREMKFNITVQTGSTALPLITASPYSATTNKKGYNTTPLVSKMETSMPRRITSTLLRTTNSTAPLYSRRWTCLLPSNPLHPL